MLFLRGTTVPFFSEYHSFPHNHWVLVNVRFYLLQTSKNRDNPHIYFLIFVHSRSFLYFCTFRFRDIIGSWATWSKLRGNNDDDWIDRLNHIYSVFILVVFALFVASGTYIQDPIACFAANEWSGKLNCDSF